ncbi:hypothetical protein D3C81_2070940 [compost metagenome]
MQLAEPQLINKNLAGLLDRLFLRGKTHGSCLCFAGDIGGVHLCLVLAGCRSGLRAGSELRRVPTLARYQCLS